MALRILNHEGKWREKLNQIYELEADVFDFYAQRPGDFFLVMLCDLDFHLAGVAEVYATLHLIGYAPTLAVAFILEAVNRVINIVFAFVSAMIGVDEAGTGLLTDTLGLSATGGGNAGNYSQGAHVLLDCPGTCVSGLWAKRKSKGKRQKSKGKGSARTFVAVPDSLSSLFHFCVT